MSKTGLKAQAERIALANALAEQLEASERRTAILRTELLALLSEIETVNAKPPTNWVPAWPFGYR